MFGIYKVFTPKGQTGAKEITVTVVHADETSKDFVYQTDAAYLGEVLKSEELVEGTEGEFGMFITSVDGEIPKNNGGALPKTVKCLTPLLTRHRLKTGRSLN